MFKGNFGSFFGILHNDMGGGSAPPQPPRGGAAPPLDPPLFFKTQNALSPLLNLLEGGFKGFFEILHDDMGGGSAPPNPPRGEGCAPPRPPRFFFETAKNALSPPFCHFLNTL